MNPGGRLSGSSHVGNLVFLSSTPDSFHSQVLCRVIVSGEHYSIYRAEPRSNRGLLALNALRKIDYAIPVWSSFAFEKRLGIEIVKDRSRGRRRERERKRKKRKR